MAVKGGGEGRWRGGRERESEGWDGLAERGFDP